MDELLSLAGELVTAAAADTAALDAALARSDYDAANCHAMSALARATTAQAQVFLGLFLSLHKKGEL